MPASQGLVGWIALAAILASAVPLGANRPVAWLALALAAAVLLLAQLVIDMLRRPDPQRVAALAVPAMLYLAALAWAAFQTMPEAGSWAHPSWSALPPGEGARSISADPAAGRLLAPRLAAYGALFWIIARAAREPGRALRMTQAIALGATLLSIYGLAAAATGVNPVLELDGRRTLVSASFVNRNSFATWAAFGALANLAVFVALTEAPGPGDARRSLRDAMETFFANGWLFALGFAITVTALIASQSRAGALSAAIGLAVFLSAYRKTADAGLGARGGIGAATAVLVVVFAAAVAGSGLATRIVGASEEEARFAVFPLVIEGVTARPWLGHGLGAFQDVFRAYVTPELAFGEWDLAHNSYLENAFELGMPAALSLYLALGLIVLRVLRGTRERRRDRAWPALALGCAGVAAAHSLFDFSLQIPAVAALFAAILAIGWTQSFRAQPGPPGRISRR